MSSLHIPGLKKDTKMKSKDEDKVYFCLEKYPLTSLSGLTFDTFLLSSVKGYDVLFDMKLNPCSGLKTKCMYSKFCLVQSRDIRSGRNWAILTSNGSNLVQIKISNQYVLARQN